MSSIHELLKQVYPLKLRMELFNAIWLNWRADIKEKDQQITDLQSQLTITEKALELACDYLVSDENEDDELYKLVQNIYDDDEYLATKINYFKTKAKEMLENE